MREILWRVGHAGERPRVARFDACGDCQRALAIDERESAEFALDALGLS